MTESHVRKLVSQHNYNWRLMKNRKNSWDIINWGEYCIYNWAKNCIVEKNVDIQNIKNVLKQIKGGK